MSRQLSLPGRVAPRTDSDLDAASTLSCLAELLDAGARPRDAVTVVATDPEQARRAATVLDSGESLTHALASSGIIPARYTRAVELLEQLPQPGVGLRELAVWIRTRHTVQDARTHLTRSGFALLIAVALFAATTALAATKASTVLPWYAAAFGWAGVIVPTVVLLALNYQQILGSRGTRTVADLARRAQAGTWAEGLAVCLEANMPWPHALAAADALTNTIWDTEDWDTEAASGTIPAHLPTSLHTVLRAGEYSARTPDLLHAWARHELDEAAHAASRRAGGLTAAAVVVLAALLSAYTLILILPALGSA